MKYRTGKTISFMQLQKRFPSIPFVSAKDIYCRGDVYYHGVNQTIHDQERAREKRQGPKSLHKILREAAIKHFKNNGWDIVSHGVSVKDMIYVAVSDFVISKINELVFIECLTPDLTTSKKMKQKCRLEKYAPMWFVIQEPDDYSNSWPSRSKNATLYKRSYRIRVMRLINKHKVFFWTVDGRIRPA